MNGRKVRVLVVNPGEDFGTLHKIAPELEELNRLVGGPIEGLTLCPEASSYIHGEGKMVGLPVNVYGDLIVRTLLARTGRRLHPGDQIVGPLVVIGPPDRYGEETDVQDEIVDVVRLGLPGGVREC